MDRAEGQSIEQAWDPLKALCTPWRGPGEQARWEYLRGRFVEVLREGETIGWSRAELVACVADAFFEGRTGPAERLVARLLAALAVRRARGGSV